MDARETADLLEERRRTGQPYLEFLRVPSMSCGLYELSKGDTDTQVPHTEDEVYYVIRGRARVRVQSEDREVRPGSVVFVPAHAPHRFHEIREDLTLLVFFAPAEGTRSAWPAGYGAHRDVGPGKSGSAVRPKVAPTILRSRFGVKSGT